MKKMLFQNILPSPDAHPRSIALDFGKLVAAFGVIMIHLQPSSSPVGEAISWSFWNFAVPFFFVVSLYFFLNRAEAMRGNLYAIQCGRIISPYLFWTALYVAFRLAKHRGMLFEGHRLDHHDLLGVIVFGEGAVHLHFLPELLLYQFMGCVLILGREIFRTVLQPRTLFGFIISIGLIAYLGFAYLSRQLAAEPVRHLASLLPMGVFYFAIGYAFRVSRSVHATLWWRAGMMLVFITTQWSLFTVTPQSPIVSAFCGASLAGLLLGISLSNVSSSVRWCLGTSFGVYLIHPFWMEAMESAFARLGHPLQPYPLAAEFAAAIAILFLCMISVSVIRAFPLGATIILGETRCNRKPDKQSQEIKRFYTPDATASTNAAKQLPSTTTGE